MTDESIVRVATKRRRKPKVDKEAMESPKAMGIQFEQTPYLNAPNECPKDWHDIPFESDHVNPKLREAVIGVLIVAAAFAILYFKSNGYL